jgi:hypothetical protein
MTNLIPSPEERAREAHARRVAFTATQLSVSLGSVARQTERLQERIVTAAGYGVPRAEVEAMTSYGLPGIDVAAMIERAYGPAGEDEEADDRAVRLAENRTQEELDEIRSETDPEEQQ